MFGGRGRLAALWKVGPHNDHQPRCAPYYPPAHYLHRGGLSQPCLVVLVAWLVVFVVWFSGAACAIGCFGCMIRGVGCMVCGGVCMVILVLKLEVLRS